MMNKKALLLATLPVLSLCSCNQKANYFDNNLPFKKFAINYVIDETTNTVETQCDFDINSDEADLFDSIDNDKAIESLIGGDIVVVYYTDEDKETIDHILVEQASLLPNIEVTNHIVPGSDSYMQIHCDDHAIDQSGISYVINEDLTITYLSDLEMGMSLFGSYIPNNQEADDAPITLSYLFSFNPRL